ncbi:hypothetical protein GQ457_10G018810 [Hibiscus cannabinus]
MFSEFSVGSDGTRNQNKKRRQDEDPPDNENCSPFAPATEAFTANNNNNDSSSAPSFKDMLMGNQRYAQPDDDEPFDDDDIELIEGDVIRGMEDGMIKIDFSNRVHELAIKSLERTIVIKMLGRRINYTTFRNKLYEIWKPSQTFKLMDIENDYFLVTFGAHKDYLHVLAGGPWMIFGHYIAVEPWSKDFTTSQPYPSKIIAWIRMPGLPVTLYKPSLITELGECIGRVIKLDYQTERGRRGRFARMAVSIDLNKPLISKLVVNGRIQLIEYESLPTICFNCGKYGHVNENCPELNTTPIIEEPVTPQVPVIDNPNNPLFGPWMVVEKRQRRQPKKSTINQSNPTGVTLTESHFNPISTENPENPTHLPHENTTQFPMPAKQGDSSTQQTRTTQKPKGKSTASSKYSSAVNVRKPLQVTLSEFPMTFRSNRSRRTSNSKAQIPSGEGSKLDINKHSTVMISENFDSNTQAISRSPLTHTAPIIITSSGRPPDPTTHGVTLSANIQQSNENINMLHNKDIRLNESSLPTKSHDALMMQ